MGNTWGMVESGYRELIVMRHAKTEQDAANDRARELTSRGRSDARAGGRWLKDRGFAPDVVLVSPAARARGTADLLSAELGTTPEVRAVDDLYGASAAECVEIIASTDDEVRSVLVVGHNPTMEELAYRLQEDPADPWAPHLPTAGLVVLQVPGDWRDLAMGSAELTHWHVPRG
jgi:phosphohistidine phosphatase